MKSHLRITIETLLAAGASQHEIARRTGVDRKTIRKYQSNSPMATGSAPGHDIRPVDDYLTFFEQHAQRAAPVTTVTERNPDEHVSH